MHQQQSADSWSSIVSRYLCCQCAETKEKRALLSAKSEFQSIATDVLGYKVIEVLPRCISNYPGHEIASENCNSPIGSTITGN